MDHNKQLFDFLKRSPTALHAAAEIARLLREHGYSELREGDAWELQPGKYYVMRGGSSLIALRLPERVRALNILATHTDSPTFKLKPTAVSESCGAYARFNTEKYGGAVLPSWLDRPLSVAGRIVRKTDLGIKSELWDAGRDLCLIPSVAPHQDRDAAPGRALDPKTDLFPLLGEVGATLSEIFDTEHMLAHDLYLYNRQPPTVFGADGEFIGGARLDNLQCTYAALSGLLEADEGDSAAVFCVFDNEEVGSSTRQGADSDFLSGVLSRALKGLGQEDYPQVLSRSVLMSADNAHAVHPNHPELSDADNRPVLNGGVVIKYNANQKYTTDALSAGIAVMLCERAGVPCQSYTNRPDKPGGSTLGNIASTHASLLSADIGLAQLAMHSSYETAGSRDTEYFHLFAKTFFESMITVEGDQVIIQ